MSLGERRRIRFPSVPDRPLQHLSALESTSCSRLGTIIAHAGASRVLPQNPFGFSGFDELDTRRACECVRPLNDPRSLTAICSSWALERRDDAARRSRERVTREATLTQQRFAKQKSATQTSSMFPANPSLSSPSQIKRVGSRWLWRRCSGASQGQSWGQVLGMCLCSRHTST